MHMCDKCHNKPATVHIRKKINGVLSESYLCQECAAKQGTPLLSFVNIDSFISNLMRVSESEEKQEMPACPHCGCDLKMIQKTGRVGCAKCYDHYQAILAPLIKKIHGGRLHAQKQEQKDESTENDQIRELKHQLKKVIELEEYEKAAVLRDKIKELEKDEKP